jgi:hypothetical protein
VIAKDSKQAEQILHCSGRQIGSGHHRHLVDAIEMSDEDCPTCTALSSRPCMLSGNLLDREIAAALDRPPYVVDIRRRSAHPNAVARDINEDAILHDQIELRIPHLSTEFQPVFSGLDIVLRMPTQVVSVSHNQEPAYGS